MTFDRQLNVCCMLQVIDMRDGQDYAMKQNDFFKVFRSGGGRVAGSDDIAMLKVKDYPPNAAFAEEMPRHWQVSHHLHSGWI